MLTDEFGNQYEEVILDGDFGIFHPVDKFGIWEHFIIAKKVNGTLEQRLTFCREALDEIPDLPELVLPMTDGEIMSSLLKRAKESMKIMRLAQLTESQRNILEHCQQEFERTGTAKIKLMGKNLRDIESLIRLGFLRDEYVSTFLQGTHWWVSLITEK